MTRRLHRRRRLLWAGVLLGLVVIVAVLSVADATLRIYDQLVSATRARRSKRNMLGRGLAARRQTVLS
jgi:uncharacterized protein involved in exopolysaccharide biosynthesis